MKEPYIELKNRFEFVDEISSSETLINFIPLIHYFALSFYFSPVHPQPLNLTIYLFVLFFIAFL